MIYLGTVLGGKHEQQEERSEPMELVLYGRQERAVYTEQYRCMKRRTKTDYFLCLLREVTVWYLTYKQSEILN